MRPLLLASLLTLLAITPAQADPPALRISVRSVSGSEVWARPRRFVALSVRLENGQGEAQRGVLRAYRVSAPGSLNPEQSLFYERQVEVPGNARRSETLYYYCQENERADRLCVSFEPEEGESPPAQFPRLVLGGAKIRALIVSSRPETGESLARDFKRARVAGPQRTWPVETVRAHLDALPAGMGGYEPYDLVVVSDLDPDDLPPAQAKALLEWVAAGNDLLLVGSARGGAPPALQAIAPTGRRPGSETRQQDLRELGPLALPALGRPWPRADEQVLVARVAARAGAAILAGSKDAPLIVRGPHGAGWVTQVAFPLSSAPLRGWSGTPHVIASLLRIPREDPEGEGEVPPSPPQEELLLNLSEALETLTPPSSWVVAPFLLLYLALVAPLNFHVLSRARKLRFAQLTAGIVAVAFALFFYGIGVAFKGEEALQTQVGLVDLSAVSGGKSRVEVMTGYFSTGRGISTAEVPEGALVGPLASSKSSNREGRVRYGDEGVELSGLTLDTWSLRRFRTLRSQDLGALLADLTQQKGRLLGTLRNTTQLRLEDPVLLLPEGGVELPQLNPGVTETLDLPLPSLNFGTPWIPTLVERLLKLRGGRYAAFYGEGIGIGIGPAPYEGSMERRILATLRRRLARVPRQPGYRPALLAALADQDPGGVALQEEARTVLAKSLVLVEVQIPLAQGSERLRNLPPRIAGSSGPGGDPYRPTGGKTGLPPTLEGGDWDPGLKGPGNNKPTVLEFVWTLPASRDRPLTLKGLVFRWRISQSASKLPRFRHLWGYDLRLKRWRRLVDLAAVKWDDLSTGNQHWPPAGGGNRLSDLVHPSRGEIRLRLTNLKQDIVIHRMTLDAQISR